MCFRVLKVYKCEYKSDILCLEQMSKFYNRLLHYTLTNSFYYCLYYDDNAYYLYANIYNLEYDKYLKNIECFTKLNVL